MEFLYNLQLSFLFATAIIATFYFYKYKHTEMRLYLFLFWYIALNDKIALEYSKHYETSNYIFFTLLDIVRFSIIIWILKKSIKNNQRKKIVNTLLYSLWLFYLVNFLFLNPLNEDPIYAFIYGAIITVISIMYYSIDLIKSAEVSKIKKDLLLWINIGFLIFNISYPIILTAHNFYDPLDSSETNIRLYDIQLPVVTYIISIISSLVIIFGFIWSEKRSQHN